jgi:hypothetical protein
MDSPKLGVENGMAWAEMVERPIATAAANAMLRIISSLQFL